MSNKGPPDDPQAATSERRLRFGQALVAARRARRFSQSELGRWVGGVVQATISSWESGTSEPTPEQTFELERVMFGSPTGALSRWLGYMPIMPSPEPSVCAADYLVLDPTLQWWAVEVLINFYAQLSGLKAVQPSPSTPSEASNGNGDGNGDGNAESARILSTMPSGGQMVFEEDHVKRFMVEILALLRPSDVIAVTLHRESGDHRYELAPALNDGQEVS